MATLSTSCILSVKYTAAGPSVKRSVGRFLRYVQYRDHSLAEERADGVDGFLRYAAYRDRTTATARLFNARGDADEGDRRKLADQITRSVAAPTHERRPPRAMYRLVLSPEDARGLDLRQMTRTVMAQLERDAGPAGLPPWIAAEHRNTAHPHVHVVLAARREVSPGNYRAFVITKGRLQRMKDGLDRELHRQRGRPHERAMQRLTGRYRGAHVSGWSLGFQFSALARRLAAHYRREAEREMDRLEWERERPAQERDRGWER